MAKRVILTGLPESGKTTLCQKVVELAQSHQIDIKGVFSPPVFINNEKIAIDLVNLSTREHSRLADLRSAGSDTTELSTRKWAFDPIKMVEGNQILSSATPCDLLVVDELGPLEFVRNEGWQTGLEAVDSGDFNAALIVVRPGLLETALRRWPKAKKVEILSPDQVPELFSITLELLGLPE